MSGSLSSALQKLNNNQNNKKWVQIFEDRVEYKLQTKTYRISNQKFTKPSKQLTSEGSTEILSLPPINTSGSFHSKSPSNRGGGINSPSRDMLEDSVSVLTDLSPTAGRRNYSSRIGGFGAGFEPSTSFTLNSFGKEGGSSSMYTIRECKHTAENLLPPPRQLDWAVSWGSQLLCYLCNQPAINDCTICKKCNMVAHYLCIVEANMKENEKNHHLPFLSNNHHGMNPLKIQTSIRQSFSNSNDIINHKCMNCEEAYNADLQYYEYIIQQIKEKKLMELSAMRIGYRALIFIEKCRLMKKKKKIIKIQAIVRGILTRKKLHQTLFKRQQKIILLQFHELPTFLSTMADCLLIISTHDTFKNIQLFRFDKTYSSIFEEVIMIPGFSWYQTLLITIGVKDVTTGVYSLIGQAQLSLRDITKKARKVEIELNFLEKISWIPQDAPGIKSPSLSIPYRLVPFYADFDDFTVSFSFMPQNPVTTVCQMISAPPLDILKRPAEIGMKHKRRAPPSNKGLINPNASMTSSMTVSGPSTATAPSTAGNSSLSYRNSRYWLCLHQLKLWLYQYYGDATPRFASDVTHATVSVVRDKGRVTSLVTLIHADQRTWVLEFGDKQEATRFETALNESKKAFFEGRSIYAKKEEMFESYHFGFNLTIC